MIPRILLLILLLSVSIAAQTPAAPSPNDEVKKAFTAVNGWVVKSAEMVPADKYNYKPIDTVRTFGQQLAHIADTYNYFCAHAVGNKVEYSEAVEKGGTDKETLLPKLKEAVGRCTAAYDAKDFQFRPLFDNLGHTNMHYGNIITYLRMMGLKPPSS